MKKIIISLLTMCALLNTSNYIPTKSQKAEITNNSEVLILDFEDSGIPEYIKI